MMLSPFQQARLRLANSRAVDPAGQYVLYWAQMCRRLGSNHALDYALAWATELKKPLVIYEGLKLDYPWANARFHQFLLEGMAETARLASERGFIYWPFVETPEQDGRGLVVKLASQACLLITDDYPQFIVPAQISQVGSKSPVAVHAIDGNSMVPLALLGPPTAAAAHLRPKWHKLFEEAWRNRAISEPVPPRGISNNHDAPFRCWQPPADLSKFVCELPIDQSVKPVQGAHGGSQPAHKLLHHFVKTKLNRYADERSKPDDPAKNSASALSFHLHYGHISIQDVCEAVLGPDWKTSKLNLKTRNKDNFFCDDANVNSYLDEAITWRDVGYQWHYAQQRLLTAESGGLAKSWQESEEMMPSFNYTRFDFSPLPAHGTLKQVLPGWAYETLQKHQADRRAYLYTPEQFEAADTHDPLWNAAQLELVATGRIHNYLRMLWGKKVLEWSETPEQAYRTLEYLNNKYALDGRDPNSYTGILWCFGLFDRPWPPERKIFGNIRYMTSDSTAKKFKLTSYYDYVRGLVSPQQGSAKTPPTRSLFD